MGEGKKEREYRREMGYFIDTIGLLSQREEIRDATTKIGNIILLYLESRGVVDFRNYLGTNDVRNCRAVYPATPHSGIVQTQPIRADGFRPPASRIGCEERRRIALI